MGVSTVQSAAVFGLRVELVNVEADVGNGLPAFHMVGYLSSEVKEAGERVRTAIRNSGLEFPAKKTVINLSPATIRKRGAAFDLPIAIAILTSLGTVAQKDTKGLLILGELGLDGAVHKVPGVLPVVMEAKKQGICRCMIPLENEQEARLVDGMEVTGVQTLKEAFEWIKGTKKRRLSQQKKKGMEVSKGKVYGEERECAEEKPDFQDICGQSAVKRAVEVAVAGGHNLLMVGPPGSGKTIVAIFLLKYLRDSEEFQDKKIGFVVPQTSLRKTLKGIFRSIYGLKSSDVLSPSDVTKQFYDILLVDEAHRLHQYKNISYMGAFKKNCEKIGLTIESDELDWILHQCKCPVLFYDEMQVVGPSGIDVSRFHKKMEIEQAKRMITYYNLFTQMRVNGGNDYIEYVKNILSGTVREKKNFENYEFRLMTDFKAFNDLMYQKEEEVQLVRMVAGYAWEWISKNDKTVFDIEIQGIKKQWNHCTEGWVHSKEAINEVGCIHSTQGYDLNYAFIILGDEIGYDPVKKKIMIRPENYYDQNGKKTVGYEELKEYIQHIYYVLMTRGIRGSYLYVCDQELRKYISQYVDTV